MQSRSLRFDSETKWWIPVVQQRRDNREQMQQEQFPRVQMKFEIPQSELAEETMRNEIRRMNLEKRLEHREMTLNQAVVRIVNEAARAWSIEFLRPPRPNRQ